ncbi:uncharacterized [Tachysurus ichikawai]
MRRLGRLTPDLLLGNLPLILYLDTNITAPEQTGGESREKRDKLTHISTPDGPRTVTEQSTATVSCQVDIEGLFRAVRGHIYWDTVQKCLPALYASSKPDKCN